MSLEVCPAHLLILRCAPRTMFGDEVVCQVDLPSRHVALTHVLNNVARVAIGRNLIHVEHEQLANTCILNLLEWSPKIEGSVFDQHPSCLSARHHILGNNRGKYNRRSKWI